jgi:integrase/recombinase XerD
VNISELINHYVTFRQTLGEKCQSHEGILRSFCRAIGPQTIVTQISAAAVMAFLAGAGAITRAWHGKYHALKGFFRFALSRGHLTETPLPAFLPKRPEPFVPYIYSREEVGRLLAAIPCCGGKRFWIEAPTLRALLLLLYGAGLRASEALGLSSEHADLTNAVLTVERSKFFKTRLVPLGQDLTSVLADYARWRENAHPPAGGEGRFFVSKHGQAISLDTLEMAFQRLREKAGVRRCDGARYQPRLHDLRHTFAVHRLIAGYQQGQDVQRLLNQLSIYLGHACLAATQIYLSMTPELLRQASTKFARYALGEDHHD